MVLRHFLSCALACVLCLPAWHAQAARDPYPEGLKAYRAGQYTKAYKTLLPLARKKDPRAMYLVGVMYEAGRGVPQDDPTAAGWLEGSARAGNASAQYLLARMTIEGRGVEKSRDKGVALLRAAAEQGHKESVALLARLGAGPAPDAASGATAATAAKAAPATTTAAAATTPAAPATTAPGGSASAAGASPASTSPLEKPIAVIFARYDRKAAQAALTAFGALLQRGAQTDGTEARRTLPQLAPDVARQLWHAESVGDVETVRLATQIAREQRVPLAALVKELTQSGTPEALGVAGLLEGLPAPDLAVRPGCATTIRAARADFAFAWFQGARCIANENPRQASDWMRAAAAAGHAGAQESVGRACVEADPPRWACAREWLGRAAEAGRPSAMPVLGWALTSQPNPSESDLRIAIKWYEQAASSGDTFAMNNLAALFERGPADVRDLARARQWYARGAQAGFAPAQFNLGRMLAAGLGGTADRPAATEWLRKADAAGIVEARAALEQLTR